MGLINWYDRMHWRKVLVPHSEGCTGGTVGTFLKYFRLFEGSKIERNISKDSILSISSNIVKCKNPWWSLPDASFTFGIWKQILNDFYNLGNDLSRGGQRDTRRVSGLDHWSNLSLNSKFHPNFIHFHPKVLGTSYFTVFGMKKGNKYLKPCKWETTSTLSWSRNKFAPVLAGSWNSPATPCGEMPDQGESLLASSQTFGFTPGACQMMRLVSWHFLGKGIPTRWLNWKGVKSAVNSTRTCKACGMLDKGGIYIMTYKDLW